MLFVVTMSAMKSSALLLVSLSLASVLHAQDGRRFETTSIKETRSFETRVVFQPGPTGINIEHATAQEIVAWAHDMLDHDVAGGPDWVRSTRFHVTAKSVGAPLKPSEIRTMLRALLVARFGLDAVIEPVEKPVYALVGTDRSGRGGPGLRARAACSGPPDVFREIPSIPMAKVTREGCGISFGTNGGRLSGVIGYGATIPELAKVLSRFMDRPVIDRTELSGQFDFLVNATPGGVTRDEKGHFVPVVTHSGFDLLPSLRDDLGFNLESTRAQVPVVAIRRIQFPTN